METMQACWCGFDSLFLWPIGKAKLNGSNWPKYWSDDSSILTEIYGSSMLHTIVIQFTSSILPVTYRYHVQRLCNDLWDLKAWKTWKWLCTWPFKIKHGRWEHRFDKLNSLIDRRQVPTDVHMIDLELQQQVAKSKNADVHILFVWNGNRSSPELRQQVWFSSDLLGSLSH